MQEFQPMGVCDMKQEKVCGWCNDTDEIEPMRQGGNIHMMCSKCGSNAGVIEFEELRKAYVLLARENKLLKERLIDVVDVFING